MAYPGWAIAIVIICVLGMISIGLSIAYVLFLYFKHKKSGEPTGSDKVINKIFREQEQDAYARFGVVNSDASDNKPGNKPDIVSNLERTKSISKTPPSKTPPKDGDRKDTGDRKRRSPDSRSDNRDRDRRGKGDRDRSGRERKGDRSGHKRSPDKKRSPERKRSPDKKRSPERKRSTDRKRSPDRKASRTSKSQHRSSPNRKSSNSKHKPSNQDRKRDKSSRR